MSNEDHPTPQDEGSAPKPTEIILPSDGEQKPMVLFFAGTGAVEEAWAPIYRALRRTISPNLPDDAELANLEMARVVHLLRFFHGRHPETEQRLKTELRALRTAIAEELREADRKQQLIVRPLFLEALSRFGRGYRVGVITTNWDTSLDRAVTDLTSSGVSVYHLHGSADDPDCLYLPTEFSMETYRDKSEQRQHAGLFRGGISAVQQATRLVIYGLSMSPLDAELCQLFWVGRDSEKQLEEVHVIDLEPKKVARRLVLVAGADRMPSRGVQCHRPSDQVSFTVGIKELMEG